ncbi:mucin-5AC isoform X4 [Anopheles gambiae]|nr:mucin-5AC isoform X4 [Anopheles gambiae]XP_061507934.1 mucin-5AC isoform X4 [Anopheles gambiae]XP_061507935.1 mucin-5AC isoform X4 [Anopheles gambiae]XP_061507936.1 mucin-5AC isoform X4 [Anopheles gambiae]XP_061507938.1 mucin-5AC isoform X4 [Anopheles gambiae]XP_061507939.1 mucin-5AC isoform X4 [Anopheles gambiae]
MTVSVSQPQQPIESVHCGPLAATYIVASATPRSSTTSPSSSSASPTTVIDAVASPSMALSSATMSASSSSSSSSTARPTSPGHGRASVTRESPEPDTTTHGNHSTPTSALRRLYFKTARASKAAKMAATAATTATAVAAAAASSSTVPKVVVMGSSTTSEATINTSTDSASTHVTNVTTTTDTETNDSLDLGDVSGQSEPLLSSLEDESSSIIALSQTAGNEEDENITVINGPDTPLLISYQELEDLSPRSPMFSPRESPKVTPGSNNRTQQPRTAPVSSTATRFPFDPPMSPKTYSGGVSRGDIASFARTHETMFSFDESPNPIRRPPPKIPPAPSSVEPDTPDHSPNIPIDTAPGHESMAAREVTQPPKQQQLMEPPQTTTTSTPKRLMNSFKTRKERLVQQAGSAVAAATAAVTSAGGTSGKPFKNPNYDPDLTMFPFDREAIDYDRIQRECFAVEEELLFEHDRRSDDDYRSVSAGAGGGESPSKALFEAEIFSDHYSIFQQYAYLTQQETRDAPPAERNATPSKRNRMATTSSDAFSPQRRHLEHGSGVGSVAASQPRLSKFDQIATKFDLMPSKTGSSVTAPQQLGCGTLPDLRVDYFAETSCCAGAGISVSPSGESSTCDGKARASSPAATSGGGGGGLRSMEVVGTGALAAGAINVTPNPMEGAVCTQPRATIVVQQPSLSLDYTSVETILLKNEGDFISVGEQGTKGELQSTQRKKQQREEHMRQLLDVTNTLTTEEIKDFEMRYGSPHHSRSQSVKTPGSRASGRPNQLCLPQQRSRVASMPNTGVEEEYYRLRHFSITGKGVVNRGDSLKSRRSKSNNSVASSNSSTEHLTPAAGAVAAGSARTSATCSLASSRESSTSNPASGPYKVLMLGGPAVGKSSLVSQFMTSEYLHAYDTSIDDDSGEKTVSVLLSGEESELTFIDHSYSEMAPENCMSTYDPHGYCVIYSSTDKETFLIAERILQILWTTENIAQKAVILVANKADLARCRVVTSDEGKAMATQYDCKFIETSVGINHNVDELLVGLLSQIRLKLENPEKSRDLFRKRSIRKSKRRACSPLGGAICLAGIGGSTNPSTPVSGPPASGGGFVDTPPGSAHSSPRKYRGSRTSASLKVKGLLGRVWARDSKSKSCENLHVL